MNYICVSSKKTAFKHAKDRRRLLTYEEGVFAAGFRLRRMRQHGRSGLDGQDARRVLYISGGTVQLIGLDITNGYATYVHAHVDLPSRVMGEASRKCTLTDLLHVHLTVYILQSLSLVSHIHFPLG